MKEPHIEGVATHDDPESCATAREGRSEALTGARAGSVLTRENRQSGTPTQLLYAEGNTLRGRHRESPGGPARSETRSTHGTFSRENREVPRMLATDGVADAPERPMAERRRCTPWGSRTGPYYLRSFRTRKRSANLRATVYPTRARRRKRRTQPREHLPHQRRASAPTRRRWREGAWPRGTRTSKTRTGHSAGVARPVRSTEYVKQQ